MGRTGEDSPTRPAPSGAARVLAVVMPMIAVGLAVVLVVRLLVDDQSGSEAAPTTTTITTTVPVAVGGCSVQSDSEAMVSPTVDLVASSVGAVPDGFGELVPGSQIAVDVGIADQLVVVDVAARDARMAGELLVFGTDRRDSTSLGYDAGADSRQVEVLCPIGGQVRFEATGGQIRVEARVIATIETGADVEFVAADPSAVNLSPVEGGYEIGAASPTPAAVASIVSVRRVDGLEATIGTDTLDVDERLSGSTARLWFVVPSGETVVLSVPESTTADELATQLEGRLAPR